MLAAGAGLLIGGLPAGSRAQPRVELPVEDFFRKRTYSGLLFSPGQRYIAAIAPSGGRRQLAVIDYEKKGAARLTSFTAVDVNRVYWASDTRLLFTTGDEQGLDFRSDGGLFAIDVDGKNSRTLVEPLVSTTQIRFVPRFTTPLRRYPDSPDEFLVSANDRNVESQDVYRMNVMTGRKSLVNFTSPGHVIKWVIDVKNVPRATLSMNAVERRWWASVMVDPLSDKWTTIAQWDEQLRNVIIPLAFDGDSGTSMFVASNVGRDTLALFKFNVQTMSLGEMIYGDDRYDLFSFYLLGQPLGEGGSLIFSDDDNATGKLVGLRYPADKPAAVWFDERAARLQATVDTVLPGTTNTFDVNRQRTLVFARSDTNPGAYFIFDQAKLTLEETGISVRPQINSKRMRPTLPVSWTARDGVRIDGYMTLPDEWVKGKPVPLVLHPHGGPWARDNWEFNPEVQFMANRGFAVLQVNFRGSTGYGARHLRLSYKQWGGTMIDDMIDGVEWAIKQGYADPGRVGAYGASYGGYATLMAMVRRPDLFKWGINYVGVTDMAVHQDTQPAQLYGDFFNLAKELNGDQKADAAVFDVQSPARHVSKITGPVFHAYAGSDRNVDFANGRTIRSAFDKAGKTYEWMFVGDEAHGYRQDPNVFDFYKRFDAFIKKNTPPATKA
jgi:dipeptidyl aminopeptidase/acylaminoacyl peptidase